jgi:uncharacterized protein (TIGR02646 family)
MLNEQGYLCGYTMLRINRTNECHIEHVVPQNQPDPRPLLDSDYNNLLACFPGNKLPEYRDPEMPAWDPSWPYGAHCKAGIHIAEDNFVSPLQEDVEQRFHYTADGSINVSPEDNAAASTIQILKLDHPQLIDLRKAALEERILDNESLTVEAAEALSRNVLQFDATGRLPEFCLAISQVAAWYAQNMR